MSKSFREKGLHGIFWTFGQQFGGQIIQFIVSIILARLLLPEEFGVLGMIAVLIAIGDSLVDNGMSSSLIRSQKNDDKDFSTVFYINLITSFCIYLIFFLLATKIANFFGHLILIDLIKVYCLLFVIRSLSAIQFTRLTMLLDFKSQTIVKIPSLILSSILGLILAYNGYGVWSLVYMQLAQGFLEMISVWYKVKWIPSLIFDWKTFKYHFNFGYKLTLSGIINTLYENAYNIIIGKYFSAAQLGFYTRAQSMKQLPVSNISTALNKVTYPLFASIQNDDMRLKNLYKKLMQQVLFWIAPILILAGVLGEPLFRFLLTEKWVPAVPYFQILCLVGIMYPLHAYNLNILNVKGRSDLFLKLEIIKKIMITIGLIIALPFGIYGLLWMQLAFSILSFFINSSYSGRMINYHLKEQILDIIPILGLATLSGIFVFLFDYNIINSSTHDFIRLSIGGLLGAGFYILISTLVTLPALNDFKDLILKK